MALPQTYKGEMMGKHIKSQRGSKLREFCEICEEMPAKEKHNGLRRARTAMPTSQRVLLEQAGNEIKEGCVKKHKAPLKLSMDGMNELMACLGLWMIDNGVGDGKE